jgi:hypothetical protein
MFLDSMLSMGKYLHINVSNNNILLASLVEYFYSENGKYKHIYLVSTIATDQYSVNMITPSSS